MQSGVAQASIAVAMLGARMHYAVPVILHRHRALSRFFTDIAFRTRSANLLQALGKRIGGDRLNKLAGRSPQLPGSLVKAFPAFGLEYAARLRRAVSRDQQIDAFLWAGETFCRRVIDAWTSTTSRAYVFNSAGLELIEWLAARGGSSVVEQTSTPMADDLRLLTAADSAFPGWANDLPTESNATRRYAERERREWERAEVVVTGSEFVREALLRGGCPAEKVRVVPYGVDLAVRPRQPQSGTSDSAPARALFVGRVNLRKGAPLLDAAARRNLPRSVRIRAVGPIEVPATAATRLAEVADLIGPVPRSRVANELAQADFFVFPSFCEGSATVCYEALAAGLPVITTPNAGSVVRDGVDGFVVPAGDVDAFSAKVELLARDRDLRRTMGENALQRAREFTVAAYGERLLKALGLHQPMPAMEKPSR